MEKETKEEGQSETKEDKQEDGRARVDSCSLKVVAKDGQVKIECRRSTADGEEMRCREMDGT